MCGMRPEDATTDVRWGETKKLKTIHARPRDREEIDLRHGLSHQSLTYGIAYFIAFLQIL